MNALRADDAETWLETIWNALHSHRETCIPEGGRSCNDEEWDDL
jgi:hypothetical protein